MTHKHFNSIAALIAAQRAEAEPHCRDALDTLADDLATYFAHVNPLFDRARFLRAARGDH